MTRSRHKVRGALSLLLCSLAQAPGGQADGEGGRGGSSEDAGGAPDAKLEIHRAPSPETPLVTVHLRDIIGMRVGTAEGERLGRVRAVVAEPRSNRPFAVVSLRDPDGIGDRSIVFDLQQAAMRDDGLVVVSEHGLGGFEGYDPARYRTLDADRSLVEIPRRLPADQTSH